MRNLIKFLFALFSVGTLLFVSCQNDENQVIETPDLLSNNSALTSRLKQATFSNDSTSVDNVLDSTSCFKVKFPYTVYVNGYFSTTIQSEADYAEVAAIFNASQIDQDHIEFRFPITVNTLEGGEVVINNEQEFYTLSLSCQHSEQVFPCLYLRFPITFYSYNTNLQVQQTHTFNSSSEIYMFLMHLGDGEFYQIGYPLYIAQANGESIKINNNAELLSAIETAVSMCNPTETPCENPDILTNRLIIYMPFANEARDLVSGNVVSNVSPRTFAVDRNGNPNSAILFSGDTEDYLKLAVTADNNIEANDSLSVSLWFRRPNVVIETDVQGLFQKLGSSGYGLYLGNNDIPMFAAESSAFFDPTWTAGISSNWHHLVLTASESGRKVSLYRDGVLVNEMNDFMPFLINSQVFDYYFGKDFTGFMDDVRVYRKVLTPQEVQILYNLDGDNNTCLH